MNVKKRFRLHKNKMNNLIEKLKEINKLSLKERRQKVMDELKKENLNLEELDILLLMDNTNENLLYRYILSSNKNDFYDEMEKFSYFINPSKINDLQDELFGKHNLGFRNITNKNFFFQFLSAIKEGNLVSIDKKLSIINSVDNTMETNNQPFNINNLEAFYYHISCLLVAKIEDQKKREKSLFLEYLDGLKKYLLSLSDELNKYEQSQYNEKDDLKKFLIIIFSIINYDYENRDKFSQVPKILKKPNEEYLKTMASVEIKKIEEQFGKEDAEQFKKAIENKDIFCNFYNIGLIDKKIYIPEECYLYDYIINNSVFKKYESQLISLLNIIYKSDLFKQLVRIIYKQDYKVNKFYFEEDDFVQDFWNNNIIFVPFNIEKVSGFSYKDTFTIFFCIYKIKHFKTEVENEIFTLGAFIRVLIHESLGHLIVANLFYLFYANIYDYNNYYTPQIKSQIENLNKENLCEYIGNTLAEIFIQNLDKLEQNDSKKCFNDSMKRNLQEKYEKIIGKDYAKTLIEKLEEKIDILNLNNKDNLSEISKQIVDILVNLISKEFDDYIANLTDDELKPKESGNFVEFLLFNDFSQYMTLKNCLFLLNEENYNIKNFLYFRSEFKSLKNKNNDNFIKELNSSKGIFSDLFGKYSSMYNNSKGKKSNLNAPQSFRETCGDNLNRKYEAFQCFNYERNFDNKLSLLSES